METSFSKWNYSWTSMVLNISGLGPNGDTRNIKGVIKCELFNSRMNKYEFG